MSTREFRYFNNISHFTTQKYGLLQLIIQGKVGGATEEYISFEIRSLFTAAVSKIQIAMIDNL